MEQAVHKNSAGASWRAALLQHKPLIVAGVINACCALLAQAAGLKALYLSGAGVANACYGLPDLALTTLTEVAEEVRRISAVTALPLLVDADTGWGQPLMVARSVKTLERAGAAALHLEDQVFNKRCGHRAGKVLTSTAVMVTRLQAACQARQDASFFIIARTDALGIEPLEAALARAVAYVEAGADAIFVEAALQLEQYTAFKDACRVPILANLTEFGKTPTWSAQQVAAAGVDMVLFPLTAFRAMNHAAAHVYQTLAELGSAEQLLSHLQTRQELYALLQYEAAEQQLTHE